MSQLPPNSSTSDPLTPQIASAQRVAWPVKIFVLIIILSCTIWSLPNPPPSVSSGKRSPYGSDWILYLNQKYLKANVLVSWFVNFSGLWQSWDMFAPMPSNLNIWCDQVVTFRDGSQVVHPYPRMQVLSIPVKYFKERYRKFFERANGDAYSWLWPTFAQRIALENYKNADNPPVKVELWRHYYQLKPPWEKTVEEYRPIMYYAYEVDQAKLRAQTESR